MPLVPEFRGNYGELELVWGVNFDAFKYLESRLQSFLPEGNFDADQHVEIHTGGERRSQLFGDSVGMLWGECLQGNFRHAAEGYHCS